MRAILLESTPYINRILLLQVSMLFLFGGLVLSWFNRDGESIRLLIPGYFCFIAMGFVVFLIPWSMHAVPRRIAIPGAVGFFAVSGGAFSAYYLTALGFHTTAWVRTGDPFSTNLPLIGGHILFGLLGLSITYSFLCIRKDRNLRRTNVQEWRVWRSFLFACTALLPFTALAVWFRPMVPFFRELLSDGAGTALQFLFYVSFAVHMHRLAAAVEPFRGTGILHPLLSDRESEIAARLILGDTYREIADRHCISIHTVQAHVKNIYRKTDVHSKTELSNLLNTMNMGYPSD